MKNSKMNIAWYVIYPIGIYYIVTNVATFVISLLIPMNNQNYSFIKLLTTLITLPFIYHIYRADRFQRVVPESGLADTCKDAVSEIGRLLGIMVMAVAASIALNNLMGLLPIVQDSKSYQSVAEAFYGGSIIFELLGLCICVPILEEYVFRGVVYGRIREHYGRWMSVLLSAVAFGVMHMNVVQGVYATILGVFLGICVEKTKHLYGPILAHMAANIISVIRTETDWLDWMKESQSAYACVTMAMILVFTGLYIFLFVKGQD